jgi:hypothetical protein
VVISIGVPPSHTDVLDALAQRIGDMTTGQTR